MTAFRFLFAIPFAALRLILALASLICLTSCGGAEGKFSDTDQAFSKTQVGLQVWSEVITSLSKAGIDIPTHQSAEEALSDLEKRKLIDNVSHKWMSADGWDQAFVWEQKKNATGTTIRIGSKGRNGKWEQGAGDDLYVEVQISTDGKCTVQFAP